MLNGYRVRYLAPFAHNSLQQIKASMDMIVPWLQVVLSTLQCEQLNSFEVQFTSHRKPFELVSGDQQIKRISIQHIKWTTWVVCKYVFFQHPCYTTTDNINCRLWHVAIWDINLQTHSPPPPPDSPGFEPSHGAHRQPHSLWREISGTGTHGCSSLTCSAWADSAHYMSIGVVNK